MRDSISRSLESEKAKLKEINGLVDRGAWKSVLKKYVSEDANIPSCRFMLTIKYVETENPIFESILVVQDHRDKDRTLLV